MRKWLWPHVWRRAKIRQARGNWGLADIFWGTVPLLFGAQLLAWVFFLPSGLQGHASFRQLYTAGYMVRTGHARELYDYTAQKGFQDRLVSQEAMLMPFIRPPFDALIFVPLSLLPYRSAYLMLLAMNILVLALTIQILRPWIQNIRRQKLLATAIVFSFVPVAMALMMGQDSGALLAVLAASMTMLEREKDFTAGAVAALGLFKFQLVVPLALVLLCWKRLRFFAGFCAVGVLLAVVSLWVAGPAQLRFYADSLLSIGEGATSASQQLLRYPLPLTMMTNVRGLVTGVLGNHVSANARFGLLILIAAGTFIWAVFSVPRDCRARWQVPIAITISTFISFYMFPYDLTVLLLPLLIALDRCLRPEARPEKPLAVSCVLLFLAPACLFFLISYFYVVSLTVLFLLVTLVRSANMDHREPTVTAEAL